MSHGGGVFSTFTVERGSADWQALKALNEQVLTRFGLLRGVAHLEFIKGRDDGRDLLPRGRRAGRRRPRGRGRRGGDRHQPVGRVGRHRDRQGQRALRAAAEAQRLRGARAEPGARRAPRPLGLRRPGGVVPRSTTRTTRGWWCARPASRGSTSCSTNTRGASPPISWRSCPTTSCRRCAEPRRLAFTAIERYQTASSDCSPRHHPLQAPGATHLRRRSAGRCAGCASRPIWVDADLDPARAGFRPSYDALYGKGAALVMPFVAAWLSTGPSKGERPSESGNVVYLPRGRRRDAARLRAARRPARGVRAGRQRIAALKERVRRGRGAASTTSTTSARTSTPAPRSRPRSRGGSTPRRASTRSPPSPRESA